MVIILLLLLLLFLIIYRMHTARSVAGNGNKVPQTAVIPPPPADTASVPKDSSAVSDTIAAPVQPSPASRSTKRPVAKHPDTIAVTAPDTTSLPVDTVAVVDTLKEPREDACAKDTAALWVYPDPSGGLHYGKVEVRFVLSRPATVHFQYQGESFWRKYDGNPVAVNATTTLFFDAIDSCGKVMERRSEYYEIDLRSSSPCRSGMDQVKVGTMNFCIDRYEWPNRKGAMPKAYISQYQAADSCFSAGKRLCTADEWMVACAGPYTWKYPYGQVYERYGCVTHDSMPQPSGAKPECRSFFGSFDMSGNLLEWTSTRAAENQSFMYVTGGFWESGPKSGCRDKRYSYYPQNQHNPVGFRCCSEIDASTGGRP
jgi:hypothetical protein